MRANTNILTAATAIDVGSNSFSYLNLIAAHSGGDWSQHNQLRFYSTSFAEPVSGHTIADCYLLRVQLTGVNSDGTGEGVFTLPVIVSGIQSNPGGAPIIIQQPVDLTVYAGQAATFRVFALSAVPITYQWQKAGTPIAGVTASVYTIPSAQMASAGAYSVALVNAYGSTASASAILTVILPPPGVNLFFEGGGGFFDDLFSYTPEGQLYHAVN